MLSPRYGISLVPCHFDIFEHLFSPLNKLAERAIYFTFRNFFFFFYLEQSYLSIYWTDFHDIYTKWKILHEFLPREALLSAVYAVVVCLCVCVCVCHTPVLYQNG